MMNSGIGAGCANASITTPIGRLRTMRKVWSSGASIRSVKAISAWPKLSRAPQRLMLAMQSRPRTGSPSWNFSPSRSRKVQTRQIVGYSVTLDHLRLRLVLRIDAIEAVEGGEPMVDRYAGKRC